MSTFNTAGDLVLLTGQTAGGQVGQVLYNSSGTVIQSLTTAGLEQFDSSGNLLVSLSTAGLEQYDSSAQLWIARAEKVHSAQRQWTDAKTLPTADDLGIPPAPAPAP